jgi:hypothetical protein
MRTGDGAWRILVHEDQTAELADAKGHLIMGRVAMFRIGERLAALGYHPADLMPD